MNQRDIDQADRISTELAMRFQGQGSRTVRVTTPERLQKLVVELYRMKITTGDFTPAIDRDDD